MQASQDVSGWRSVRRTLQHAEDVLGLGARGLPRIGLRQRVRFLAGGFIAIAAAREEKANGAYDDHAADQSCRNLEDMPHTSPSSPPQYSVTLARPG
jgi:hypothetical protein